MRAAALKSTAFAKFLIIFKKIIAKTNRFRGFSLKFARNGNVLTKTELYVGKYFSAQGPQSTCTPMFNPLMCNILV